MGNDIIEEAMAILDSEDALNTIINLLIDIDNLKQENLDWTKKYKQLQKEFNSK